MQLSSEKKRINVFRLVLLTCNVCHISVYMYLVLISDSIYSVQSPRRSMTRSKTNMDKGLNGRPTNGHAPIG